MAPALMCWGCVGAPALMCWGVGRGSYKKIFLTEKLWGTQKRKKKRKEKRCGHETTSLYACNDSNAYLS